MNARCTAFHLGRPRPRHAGVCMQIGWIGLDVIVVNGKICLTHIAQPAYAHTSYSSVRENVRVSWVVPDILYCMLLVAVKFLVEKFSSATMGRGFSKKGRWEER